MKRRSHRVAGNVLPFPGWGADLSTTENDPQTIRSVTAIETVICGSFRRDPSGLRRTFDELRDLGFHVLSPRNVTSVSEHDGFVFMEGEQTELPESLESRHLTAIRSARLVWLFAPEGYVGPTAAMEIGYASANGIPVFAREAPADIALRPFVRVVDSPTVVPDLILSHKVAAPSPAIQAFQKYYARAALERGYEKESAQNCLLLMLEEFGELARALRKRQKLARHGSPIATNESQELADVFIYVVHMANVLGLDLAAAVQAKEQLNVERFLRDR